MTVKVNMLLILEQTQSTVPGKHMATPNSFLLVCNFEQNFDPRMSSNLLAKCHNFWRENLFTKYFISLFTVFIASSISKNVV